MNKEIIKEKKSSISVNVVANHVESLRKVVETTSTVRVYQDGFIGVAGQVGDCDINKLEQQAIANLDNKIPYPYLPSEARVESHDTTKKIINADEFVKICESVLAKIEQAEPDFLFNNKIQYYESETEYTSSNGSKLSYKGNNLVFVLTIKYKGSANIMDFAYVDEIVDYDEDKIVANIKTLCDAYQKPATIENGKYKVIAESSLFVSNALGYFSGEMYVAGASLYKEKLNQKIFNDKVSILSNKGLDTHNTEFFDAEGDVADDYKSYVIKDGVLTALFASKKVANQYGIPRVKSSSATYDGIPSAGFDGLEASDTADDIYSLIGNDKAIYVVEASGGDITSNGDYATPAMLSFLIENGKIVGRLPDLNITGNINDYLGDGYIGTTHKAFLDTKAIQYSVCEMNVTTM